MRKFSLSLAGVGALGAAVVFGCSTEITKVDPLPVDPPTAQPAQFNGVANQAPTAPPPVTGGTLLTVVAADGSALAVAADPEEDALYVATLGASPAIVGKLALQVGDEPGRMVADAAGRVHVVLRGGGGIATVQVSSSGASLLSRRAICGAPRGIDYDAQSDALFVACSTGELVSLPAAGGAATATADLGRDLRDVWVAGPTIYVTRFRSGNVLQLDRLLQVQSERVLGTNQFDASADTAWRLAHADGAAFVLHQVASTNPIDVATPPNVSSYGGGVQNQEPNNAIPLIGTGVVSVAVADVLKQSASVPVSINPAVDLAVTRGNSWEAIGLQGQLAVSNGSVLFQIADSSIGTSAPNAYVAIADTDSATNMATNPTLVVQRRGPHPALLLFRKGTLVGGKPDFTVPLRQQSSHVDTGFDIFSFPTQAGIACMNCHPEGGDDGHVWHFAQADSSIRNRRTQNLRGGVLQGSAPYHWDGDMTDLPMLCGEVFTHRMGGGSMSGPQVSVLNRFLNAVPRIPVKQNLDATRIAAGKAFFEGPGGCNACHVGGTGTLPQNQDVGKLDDGQDTPLQVPMLLGVADRAPYMHDGCAPTLADRLQVNACAGKTHGNLAGLSDQDRANLLEFLQTL